MGNGRKYPKPESLRKHFPCLDDTELGRVHNGVKHGMDISCLVYHLGRYDHYLSYMRGWFQARWHRRLPGSGNDD
jgi:hypothetical protein